MAWEIVYSATGWPSVIRDAVTHAYICEMRQSSHNQAVMARLHAGTITEAEVGEEIRESKARAVANAIKILTVGES